MKPRCDLASQESTTSSCVLMRSDPTMSVGSSICQTESPLKSGYRIIFPVEHQNLGAHQFHSWKYVMTTDDESVSFEPLYVFILFIQTRDHIKDWR